MKTCECRNEKHTHTCKVSITVQRHLKRARMETEMDA